MSASVSYGALTLSRHCSLNSRLMSEDPAPPETHHSSIATHHCLHSTEKRDTPTRQHTAHHIQAHTKLYTGPYSAIVLCTRY